jgi:hypothetical protein
MGQAFAGFCVGFLGAFGLCIVLGAYDISARRTLWEADAVRHGAATWSVDESGKRVFEWKERKGE